MIREDGENWEWWDGVRIREKNNSPTECDKERIVPRSTASRVRMERLSPQAKSPQGVAPQEVALVRPPAPYGD